MIDTINVSELAPNGGVASEGKAWKKIKSTDSELIYERDCSYDGDRMNEREHKEIYVKKTDNQIQMIVRVIIDGDEYTYTRVSYHGETNVLKKNMGSESDMILDDVTKDKVVSIFGDLLYDESRHGANNYQYYC